MKWVFRCKVPWAILLCAFQCILSSCGNAPPESEIGDLVRDFHNEGQPNHHTVAYKLAETGDPAALRPLAVALGDDSDRMRASAAGALGKLADPRAVKPLIRVLNDPSPQVRKNAAEALGAIGSSKAAEPLGELLLRECRENPGQAARPVSDGRKEVQMMNSSGGSAVSSAATAALIDVGPDAVDTLSRVLKEGRVCAQIGAARALGAIASPTAIEPLLNVIRDAEESLVIRSAQRALVEIGKPAVKLLISALEDPNEGVRRIAAECLGELGSREATEALVRMLKDPDPVCRRQSARALKAIGDPASMTGLTELLENGDRKARAEAASALGSVDAKATPYLIEALKDEDRNVRLNAICSLGMTKDPRGLTPLVEFLKTREKRPSSGECLQTISSIGKIGGLKALNALDELLQTGLCMRHVIPALGALGALGSPATDLLIQELKHPRGRFEYLIIRALGETGDRKAAPTIAGFLKDESKLIRYEAAVALQETKDPRTTGALIKAVNDPENNVRVAAVKALGEIGSRNAVGPLLDLFQQSDYPWSTQTREQRLFGAAVKALGQIGDPKGIDTVKTVLLNDAYLHRTAAKALTGFGEAGLEALCEVFVTPGEQNWTKAARYHASEVLVQVGPQAVPVVRAALPAAEGRTKTRLLQLLTEIQDSSSMEIFLQALNDEDPEVRAWAAVSLGQKGGPEVVQPLLAAMRDPDERVARAAAGGLSLQGRPVVPAMIRMLKDKNQSIRFHAAWNLGEIGDSTAVEPLISLLVDEYGPTRNIAAEALLKMWTARMPKMILDAYEKTPCSVRLRAAGAFEYLEDNEKTAQIVSTLQKECPDDPVHGDGRLN